MTGKLGVCPPELPEAKHDHLFFVLDDGKELRYHDTRRFGSMHVIPGKDREAEEPLFFQTAGPEPFDANVTAAYLKKKARNSSQPIKTFIMNSRIIAGIGNIYANESLFAAGIHPRRPAGKLTLKQWQLLLDEIRAVLKEAIACGGSTISDFVNAGGERGYFQMNFKVYGRANQPCRLCEQALQKTVITGRASYFCAHCQKR
jgi:formamidopyrimidine-DNA glycosylase